MQTPTRNKNGQTQKHPQTDHKTHCNGCRKQHKLPCRYEYKAEYNHGNRAYPTSTAGRQATTRRKLLGREHLKVIDNHQVMGDAFIATLYLTI